MSKYKTYTACAVLLLAANLLMVACRKDAAPSDDSIAPPVFPVAKNPSFTEDFDSVGTLTAKGWHFTNNSSPIGTTGWRQGRYESAVGVQYKFLAPVPFIGFQAYNSTNGPNDFISCDASCVNDIGAGTINISAWLISPQLPLKNGDQISFYTRAVADQSYSVYTRDRMQVRANIIDGSTNVSGGSDVNDFGNFKLELLDINKDYINNDPAGNTPVAPGYPQAWTKYTITVSGIPGTGSVAKARFAFRYVGTDAGIFGGVAGNNYPTVVGIDNLVFKSN
jgi:hypothetical protein